MKVSAQVPSAPTSVVPVISPDWLRISTWVRGSPVPVTVNSFVVMRRFGDGPPYW